MATQQKPFEVDEKLLWFTDYTDNIIPVICRGFYQGHVVCYDPKTGWQGIIPPENLRRESNDE